MTQRTRNNIAAELRKAQYELEHSQDPLALAKVRDILIEQLFRVTLKDGRTRALSAGR